jgi:DNA polymerase III epsilon subunit-like protein
MTHLIFDCETTGLILHPEAKDALQPRIIEWGGLLVDGQGVELEEFNTFVNPGIELPERITKITGITQEDLIDAPTFKEIAPKLKALFEKADTLIAHNLSFDFGMMNFESMRNGLGEWPRAKEMICTVQEHADGFGHRPKLTELYEFYMEKPLAQTHRAIDDARAVKEICIAAGILR